MLQSLTNKIKMIFLKNKHRNNSVVFHKNTLIGYVSEFEGMNVIHENSSFVGKLGYGSYIGRNCCFDAKIGRFCSIASNVNVLLGMHPSSTFVSTHPAFFSTKKQCGISFVTRQKFEERLFADDEKKYPVVIGNDVWIGFGCSIIGGVKIGDGAIIAANSTVTKDVEPYSIVGGTPAKLIRKRFSQEQIELLLEKKWWDKPISWLKDNADKFENIDTFLKD